MIFGDILDLLFSGVPRNWSINGLLVCLWCVYVCLYVKVLAAQSLFRLKTDTGTAIASSAPSAAFHWSDKAFCWRTMPSCVPAAVKRRPAIAHHVIVVS